MTNIDSEFLKAYAEVTGKEIPVEAMMELTNYFPEVYGGLTATSFKDPTLVDRACADYLLIIKSYLRYYKIPFTVESLTAAYMWGIGNLRKNGLYKAPRRVKQAIAKIRHSLQPQAEMLDSEIDNGK